MLKENIMKSCESQAEMTVESHNIAPNCNHFGGETLPLRIVASDEALGVAGVGDGGAGWTLLRRSAAGLSAAALADADCLLLDSGDLAAFAVDDQARAGLPLVLAVGAKGAPSPAIDRADGFVFAGDDAVTVAAVFARATARAVPQVHDFSDGTARTINALSAEAGRIADALAKLAEAQRTATPAEAPVESALVRRLLKVRRDRERFFPAEIFADPAWDMLLDLMATRLEGKALPVSSLCIAAAVPTTTALRWIRSLTEAGLFERRVDPTDARRTYINLSAGAADAMLGWLRHFGTQFAPR